jgi:anaerobic selenocysteine-containing dehydrogenase
VSQKKTGKEGNILMEREDRGKNWWNPNIDRRKFLAVSGALATAAAAGSVFLSAKPASALTLSEHGPDPVETESDVYIIYTTCQNCHNRDGIMCKVKDGVLLKIDGNPYHPGPMEYDERLPYSTDPSEAKKYRGRCCLKGQSGIQVVYDPYRLKGPLKRVGPRGSGQWQSISWEQALNEIAAKINELIPNRDELIDPNYPELGTKANQLLFSPGRFPHADKEFGDRIWKNGFGTANYRLDHTSICEADHHVAEKLITAGAKEGFEPDILNSKYVIIFGANPLECSFALIPLSRKYMEMKRRGGKYVVVDPRLSNSAAQANGGWVAVKPGTDAALALGMARWIIDNNRYDENYLKNANKAAATADGETTWSDATWLVDLDTRKYLRDDVLGGDGSKYVVWDGSQAVAVDSHDETTAVEGTLDTGTVTVAGKSCKSVFTLLKERVQEKTIAEYADICGIDSSKIEELAQEFTSYGKQAAVTAYRGVVQHTNGIYNMLAVFHLNTLLGNFDWKGGIMGGGGHWHETGGKVAGQVSLKNVPNGKSPSGVPINRAGKDYEKDAPNIFARDGYPARRPWFPLGMFGNYQEVIPSAADGYPYAPKVLITYWNAWPYSTPALKPVFESYLKDETKLPLFVAISLNIGETAAYADYILPDTTYLEKWTTPHPGSAGMHTKVSHIRQPVIGKLDGKVIGGPGWSFNPDASNIFTSYLSSGNVAIDPSTAQGPMMLEDILIALAKKLGNMPGVGDNAFEDGASLNSAWDWNKKLFENLAIESGASLEEIIAKGGVFEDPGNEWEGNYLKHKYGSEIHIYIEQLATTKDSMTGQYFDGLPKYEPIKHADGTPVEDTDYPLHLITYKSVRHGQARTANLPWLMTLAPENYVEINSTDAQSLGISTGDKVRLSSASNPTGIVGYAKVIEGIRPGVVAVSHHYGHWELHSRPHIIDGVETEYDGSRGAGIQATPVMRVDAALGNVVLQSKIGCSASFYDTKVKVEKV